MEVIPELLKQELPKISLEQRGFFDSQSSPIYNMKIFNDINDEIRYVDYQLINKNKEIIIQSIQINQRRKGYGKAVYKYIQDMYPDYILVSSDQMCHKTNEDQGRSDAVMLWDSLVKADLAKRTETRYEMKR